MDIPSLLESFGYLFIFACIFIECGVLLGLILPLPSFSLLFTCGVLLTTGKLDMAAVIGVGTLAAILGYITGYATGSKYGRKLLYERQTERYFTAAQGKAAERFMKRHGYTTLLVSRWLPVMHNLAPLLAGVARIPRTIFMIINVVSGLLWVSSITLLGYFLGRVIPGAQYYVIGLVIIFVIISNTPFGRRVMARIAARAEKL